MRIWLEIRRKLYDKQKSNYRSVNDRAHMTAEEALTEYRECMGEIREAIEEGADYDEVEEIMIDCFGLEMDYLV